MSIFDDIRALKERREYDEAWKICSEAKEAEPSNPFLTTSLYWIAYAAIKDVTDAAEKRPEPYLTGPEEARINFWMGKINTLPLLGTDKEVQFTYLFVLFKKIKRVTTELVRFVTNNGSAVFVDSDHEPYKTEQGESPSLLLWLARATVSFATSATDVDFKRVHGLAVYALNNARDSDKGKLWLKKDLVPFYMLLGHADKARDYALSVLHANKSNGWAWSGLAETYLDEPPSAIKLYAKSILLSREDSFKLPALKGLLKFKVMEADNTGANLLLNKIVSIYEANAWQAKEDVLCYAGESWYSPNSDTSGLIKYIEALAEGAELLAVANLATKVGVITGIHGSGRKAFVYVNRSTETMVDKAVFRDKRLPEVGAFVEISGDFSSERPLIISATGTESQELQDIGVYEGALKLVGSPDKPLGFVDDVFIPPHLLASLSNGDLVSGMYFITYDKKKARYGKKAFSLVRAKE